MSFSTVVYPASGTDYVVPFPYLHKDHVFVSEEVSEDNFLSVLFTWLNDSTVRLDQAPTGDVRIFRRTSPEARLTEYVHGSSLTAQVMETDSKQAFYLAQEALDGAFPGIDDIFGLFLQFGTGAVARTYRRKVAETVSALDFGARGDGITNDTVAIQKAVDAVGARGGGIVRFPTGHYPIDFPIVLRDNVQLEGEGISSWIENIRDTEAISGTGRCVDIGNYSAQTHLNPTEPEYDLENTAGQLVGAKEVTLDTPGDADNFAVGDLVFIRSDDTLGTFPQFQQFNMVTAKNGGVISLKYGLYKGIPDTDGGPRIKKLGTGLLVDGLGIPRRMLKNIGVRNLRLTSRTNWWHSAGATFEGVFEDLFTEAENTLVLNAMAYCKFSSIYGTFDKRAIEFAGASHHNEVTNVTSTWKSFLLETTSEILVSFNEGAHNNRLSGLYITAPAPIDPILQPLTGWGGSTPIRFVFCQNNTVEDFLIVAPGAVGSGNVQFSPSAGLCTDNVARNGRVVADNGFNLLFSEGVGATLARCGAENVSFTGDPTTRAITVNGGTDCYIIGGVHQSGGYRIEAAATRFTIDRAQFLTDPFKTNLSTTGVVKNIITPSGHSLERARTVLSTDILSAVAETVISQIDIPAGTLMENDRINVLLRGNFSGVLGAKELRIYGGVPGALTLLATLTVAQANQPPVEMAGVIAIASSAIQRAWFRNLNNATTTSQTTSTTVDTNANVYRIELRGWVAVSGDVGILRDYSVRPVREGEMT